MPLSPVVERYLEAAYDIHQNPYDGEAAYTIPLKAEANGRCQRCGWGCDGSSRDRVLQVHHWDRMPENNTRSKLVALCPRCHLELHQGGRWNVSEGQMGLLGRFRGECDRASSLIKSCHHHTQSSPVL